MRRALGRTRVVRRRRRRGLHGCLAYAGRTEDHAGDQCRCDCPVKSPHGTHYTGRAHQTALASPRLRTFHGFAENSPERPSRAACNSGRRANKHATPLVQTIERMVAQLLLYSTTSHLCSAQPLSSSQCSSPRAPVHRCSARRGALRTRRLSTTATRKTPAAQSACAATTPARRQPLVPPS